MSSVQNGAALPLMFIGTACLLYVMFDVMAYHPSITPIGLYNMYACEGNKSADSQPTIRKPNQSEIEAVEGLEDDRDVKYSDLRFAIKERSNKSFSEFSPHFFL